MINIGYLIRNLRKGKKITQEELSLMLGKSRQTISSWENGKFSPEGESLLIIAKIFGVTVSYLLGETDDPNPPLVGSADSHWGAMAKLSGGRDPSDIQPETVKDGVRRMDITSQRDGQVISSMITIERKDGTKYTLPPSPESYDYLKQIDGEKEQIEPEDKAILEMLKELTPEEKKEMYEYLSSKKFK